MVHHGHRQLRVCLAIHLNAAHSLQNILFPVRYEVFPVYSPHSGGDQRTMTVVYGSCKVGEMCIHLTIVDIKYLYKKLLHSLEVRN